MATEKNRAQAKTSAGAGTAALEGIRVARISTVPFFVLTQLKRQIESVSASGAHVVVVTSSGPEFSSLQALTGVACELIEIPRSISPWRDCLALWQLFRFFRRSQIDIAHSTTPKAGLLTAVAAFLAGVPVRLHTFTGQPWVNMQGVMRRFARASDSLIARLNTRCYTDSASQRQFLIEQGVIPPGKLFVLGAGSLAGVDTGRFNPARFAEQERLALRRRTGIPQEAPVLLFVGRITADKGVRELLDAFRKLKTAGSAAHLLFVGHFDSEIGGGAGITRRDIEGVRDVHVAGFTQCPEMYMAIADILCLPSYREGFGTVVIEAAAMGVPTVGSDIYGLSDAVVNGETGMLVPPRDAPALAGALSELLSDAGRRRQMGAAARQRAEALFDAGQVNGRLIAEYCNLLDAGKRH